MNYIYHIYAKNDPTTLYIGQSSASGDGYKRALEHFSGAWGRSRGWNDDFLFGNKSYENPKFQKFMLSHALDEMVIEIYDDTYFGIPKQDFERFAAKWFITNKTTLEVRQQQRTDNAAKYMLENKTIYSDQERLNIAEIMHIYYYGIQLGWNVLAMSIGGQNKVMLSTEGNVLNREMSPSQMRVVIEHGSSKAFQELQKVFSEKLEKELEMSKQGDNLYKALAVFFAEAVEKKSSAKQSFSAILDQWFSRHLEQIIREMQDKVAHTADGFRIQWPKDHTEMISAKTTGGEVNSLLQAFVVTLSDNKKKLEAALKEDMSNPNFNKRKMPTHKYQNLISLIKNIIEEKVKIGIGIANIIKIKPLSQTVKIIATSNIKNGKNITKDAQSTLKNISYNFFRRCAEVAKSEISGVLGNTVEDIVLNNHFRKTLAMDDQKRVLYKVISAETFYNRIWEIYKSFGITAHFIRANEWPDFCRGMLTIYTKNNGTVTGGRLEIDNIEGMFLGSLGSYEYEDKIIIPAYEFTPETANFIEQNGSMNVENLTIY